MFLFILCVFCVYSCAIALKYDLDYDCKREDDFYSIQLPTSDHLTIPYHRGILNSLNDKLLDKCEDYYDFNFINLTSKPPFYHTWNYINLFDPHYYEEQFEKDQHFVYAGDINVSEDKTEAYVNVANFTHNSNITTDPKENHTKDIWKKERVKDTQAAKLVTRHLELYYKNLFNFTTSIQFDAENNITTQASCMPFATEPNDLKYVLICSFKKDCFASDPYSKKLKFIYRYTKECEEAMETYHGSILAVIAPKPFQMRYETKVPAIFYTSFSDSRYESQFPNSLNLVLEEQGILKQAFLKFIRQFGWRRVAIISDYAPNSIKFERELTKLFYEEGIVHKVVYGDGKEEFRQAIRSLQNVDTRIVIANVNEFNALKLATLTASYQSGFVFLFRVPPVWAFPSEKFITISLGVANNHPCKIKGEFNSFCSGILEGLRIVAKAHSKFENETKTSKNTFYRKFKEYMETLRESRYEVTVARAISLVISTMTYDKQTGVLTTYHHTDKPIFNLPILSQKRCSYKSNNFDKPCDPMPLLFIMLVVMMFAILVLILTCYFHNTSPLKSTTYEQL